LESPEEDEDVYVKTSYMNFHNVDLCWAVFRVELDDTGNPLDPVITDCSKKFEDTMISTVAMQARICILDRRSNRKEL